MCQIEEWVIFADDVASLLEGSGSYIKDMDSKREGALRIIHVGAVKVWAERELSLLGGA